MSDLTERLRSIKVMRLGGDIGTPVHCGLMPDPLSNEAADALDAKDAEIAALKSRVGWTKEMGFILEGANADEIAAYDCGCTESLAAFTKILDGRDTGAGTSNEPWESVRRKALALRADAERHDNKLFALGWTSAAAWAKRPDLIADIDSPAYRADRRAARGTT